MSGHRTSPPQFDMVASARRSWSLEQKRSIVAEVDATGASVSEVARRHGVHTSQLFRWRRVYGTRAAGSTAEERALPAPTFVPVVVSSRHRVALPPPSPWAASTPASAGMIEIAIAGGRTLRVGGDVDTAALVRIIDALEAGR
jgi:transposase